MAFAWQEESLMLSLSANINYTLKMVYYGYCLQFLAKQFLLFSALINSFSAYETSFCESIVVELMVLPLTSNYAFDFCAGHLQALPVEKPPEGIVA